MSNPEQNIEREIGLNRFTKNDEGDVGPVDSGQESGRLSEEEAEEIARVKLMQRDNIAQSISNNNSEKVRLEKDYMKNVAKSMAPPSEVDSDVNREYYLDRFAVDQSLEANPRAPVNKADEEGKEEFDEGLVKLARERFPDEPPEKQEFMAQLMAWDSATKDIWAEKRTWDPLGREEGSDRLFSLQEDIKHYSNWATRGYAGVWASLLGSTAEISGRLGKFSADMLGFADPENYDVYANELVDDFMDYDKEDWLGDNVTKQFARNLYHLSGSVETGEEADMPSPEETVKPGMLQNLGDMTRSFAGGPGMPGEDTTEVDEISKHIINGEYDKAADKIPEEHWEPMANKMGREFWDDYDSWDGETVDEWRSLVSKGFDDDFRRMDYYAGAPQAATELLGTLHSFKAVFGLLGKGMETAGQGYHKAAAALNKSHQSNLLKPEHLEKVHDVFTKTGDFLYYIGNPTKKMATKGKAIANSAVKSIGRGTAMYLMGENAGEEGAREELKKWSTDVGISIGVEGLFHGTAWGLGRWLGANPAKYGHNQTTYEKVANSGFSDVFKGQQKGDRALMSQGFSKLRTAFNNVDDATYEQIKQKTQKTLIKQFGGNHKIAGRFLNSFYGVDDFAKMSKKDVLSLPFVTNSLGLADDMDWGKLNSLISSGNQWQQEAGYVFKNFKTAMETARKAETAKGSISDAAFNKMTSAMEQVDNAKNIVLFSGGGDIVSSRSSEVAKEISNVDSKFASTTSEMADYLNEEVLGKLDADEVEIEGITQDVLDKWYEYWDYRTTLDRRLSQEGKSVLSGKEKDTRKRRLSAYYSAAKEAGFEKPSELWKQLPDELPKTKEDVNIFALVSDDDTLQETIKETGEVPEEAVKNGDIIKFGNLNVLENYANEDFDLSDLAATYNGIGEIERKQLQKRSEIKIQEAASETREGGKIKGAQRKIAKMNKDIFENIKEDIGAADESYESYIKKWKSMLGDDDLPYVSYRKGQADADFQFRMLGPKEKLITELHETNPRSKVVEDFNSEDARKIRNTVKPGMEQNVENLIEDAKAGEQEEISGVNDLYAITKLVEMSESARTEQGELYKLAEDFEKFLDTWGLDLFSNTTLDTKKSPTDLGWHAQTVFGRENLTHSIIEDMTGLDVLSPFVNLQEAVTNKRLFLHSDNYGVPGFQTLNDMFADHNLDERRAIGKSFLSLQFMNWEEQKELAGKDVPIEELFDDDKIEQSLAMYGYGDYGKDLRQGVEMTKKIAGILKSAGEFSSLPQERMLPGYMPVWIDESKLSDVSEAAKAGLRINPRHQEARREGAPVDLEDAENFVDQLAKMREYDEQGFFDLFMSTDIEEATKAYISEVGTDKFVRPHLDAYKAMLPMIQTMEGKSKSGGLKILPHMKNLADEIEHKQDPHAMFFNQWFDDKIQSWVEKLLDSDTGYKPIDKMGEGLGKVLDRVTQTNKGKNFANWLKSFRVFQDLSGVSFAFRNLGQGLKAAARVGIDYFGKALKFNAKNNFDMYTYLAATGSRSHMAATGESGQSIIPASGKRSAVEAALKGNWILSAQESIRKIADVALSPLRYSDSPNAMGTGTSHALTFNDFVEDWTNEELSDKEFMQKTGLMALHSREQKMILDSLKERSESEYGAIIVNNPEAQKKLGERTSIPEAMKYGFKNIGKGPHETPKDGSHKPDWEIDKWSPEHMAVQFSVDDQQYRYQPEARGEIFNRYKQPFEFGSSATATGASTVLSQYLQYMMLYLSWPIEFASELATLSQNHTQNAHKITSMATYSQLYSKGASKFFDIDEHEWNYISSIPNAEPLLSASQAAITDLVNGMDGLLYDTFDRETNPEVNFDAIKESVTENVLKLLEDAGVKSTYGYDEGLLGPVDVSKTIDRVGNIYDLSGQGVKMAYHGLSGEEAQQYPMDKKDMIDAIDNALQIRLRGSSKQEILDAIDLYFHKGKANSYLNKGADLDSYREYREEKWEEYMKNQEE